MKMNESEIIYELTIFIFCYLIWPGTSSPCISTASCCCTVSCLLLCCAVCRCSCCHVRVPHTVVYPYIFIFYSFVWYLIWPCSPLWAFSTMLIHLFITEVRVKSCRPENLLKNLCGLLWHDITRTGLKVLDFNSYDLKTWAGINENA